MGAGDLERQGRRQRQVVLAPTQGSGPQLARLTRTMKTTSAPQIDQLAAAYTGGQSNRRDFLARLTILTGSMAATHLLLEKSGLAQIISQHETAANAGDIPKISGTDVDFGRENVKLTGYLAAPDGDGPFPGVVVIHENRGLNEHTRDVARRLAREGFVALAPDALARLGGTASMADPDAARTAIGTLTPEQIIADLDAALVYLQAQTNVRKGGLGSIGFCWGGARSFLLATNDKIRAAVVFYGSAPDAAQIADIVAPVLGLYGATDERISSKVPEVAAQMKAAGKAFDYQIYAGAGHAFFNDTGERYNPQAAADAWPRAVGFLRENLKAV